MAADEEYTSAFQQASDLADRFSKQPVSVEMMQAFATLAVAETLIGLAVSLDRIELRLTDGLDAIARAVSGPRPR